MKDVRVGIVGCGGIAFGKHMPNLKKLANVKMVSFCDLIEERAVKAAGQYGIADAAVGTEYRELLRDDAIDVVHVLTPNASHAEISVAALRAGKHVMCEKPMAISGREARAMCAAARETGRKLTIGYQSRSRVECQYLRKLIRKGDLGEVYFVRCPALRRRGIPGWGVFTDKAQQGGGPLIDIATHSIDLALHLIGNYEVASVMGASFRKLADTAVLSNDMGRYDPATFTTEDAAFGFVRFRNGCVMVVESSWALNIVDGGRTTICGTLAGAEIGGTIKLNGEKDGCLYVQEITPNSRARDLFPFENLTPEEYEQKQWMHSVVHDTEPLVKPEEAAVVSEIIEAIYTSAETGRAVSFDPQH
ncbi:MAG: Gfo/Idh/MocA family oxidoreductase [Lentisphaeria bacterium]|nr:Gfo/Idh/MocA family oxidoreductase [Lentisphaeria bacterium]